MNKVVIVLSESHSYRSNEDGCQIGADEQVHSCEQRQNCSETKKGKPCNTRYFIIKSLNHQNIELSIEKGIWATQVMNEPILEEAFRVRIPFSLLEHFMKIFLLFFKGGLYLFCRTLEK